MNAPSILPAAPTPVNNGTVTVRHYDPAMQAALEAAAALLFPTCLVRPAPSCAAPAPTTTDRAEA